MSEDKKPAELTPLEAVELKRAERRAARQAEYDAQRVKDLEALTDLEDEHGSENIGHIDVPFSPGSPTLVAVKTPEKKYVKRYRETVKPNKDGSHSGKSVEAAETLAACVVVYPAKEVYESICEARAGVAVAAGMKALELVSARESSEGKA
jgi:hypothetical protein